MITETDTALNTSSCSAIDLYDVSYGNEFVNEWISWQGGIPFLSVFWLLNFVLVFGIQYLGRLICGSHPEEPAKQPENRLGFIEWITLSIDESSIDLDEAIILRFTRKVLAFFTWIMVPICILLILVNFNGNLMKEIPKSIRSMGINNIGINGIHSVTIALVSGAVAWFLWKHCSECKIQSLASPTIPNENQNKNRRCLRFSGIDHMRASSSLKQYKNNLSMELNEIFVSRLDIKGIDQIFICYNSKPIFSTNEKLNFVETVLEELNDNPEEIYPGVLNLVSCGRCLLDPVDAKTHFKEEKLKLLGKLKTKMEDLEFTGNIFVVFNTEIEAINAKLDFEHYQSKKEEKNDSDFKPLKWKVSFAPPSSEVNWSAFKGLYSAKSVQRNESAIITRIVFKIFSWIRSIVKRLCRCHIFVAFCFICLTASPGIVFRLISVAVENESPSSLNVFFNRFVVSLVITFMSSKFISWVTQTVGELKAYKSRSDLNVSVLSFSCFLEISSYLTRMLIRKPLPLLILNLFGGTIEQPPWECLFYPSHASIITCFIITCTASNILFAHSQLGYWFKSLWKKLTLPSKAQFRVWQRTYKTEFDFSSTYAEITTIIVLTLTFFPVFPVIGLVSWICLLLRFISDRSTLMASRVKSTAEATGTSGAGLIHYRLHQKAVNIVLVYVLGTPVFMFIFRLMQTYKRNTHNPNEHLNYLTDSGILGPSLLFVAYSVALIYANHQGIFKRLRRFYHKLLKCFSTSGTPDRPREEADQEALLQHSEYVKDDNYDPLKMFRQSEWINKFGGKELV